MSPEQDGYTVEPRHLLHVLNEDCSMDVQPYPDGPLPPPGRMERSGVADAHALSAPRNPFGEDEGRKEGTFAGKENLLPAQRLFRENDTLAPICLDATRNPTSDGGATINQNRPLATRDDYLQLPTLGQRNQPTLPPIISGLHQPPNHPGQAVRYPPIVSNSFDDDDVSLLPLIQGYGDYGYGSPGGGSMPATPPTDPTSTKGRKKGSKPRRRWSEEESTHLLLGVKKHGQGQWTLILNDTEFKFQDRSAGDLKDRFRTICPDELNKGGLSSVDLTQALTKTVKKGSLKDILREDDHEHSGMITPPREAEGPSKSKKPRAHRKKLEDLHKIGIDAPFKKSSRRTRTPFTDRDDQEILQGMQDYKTQWSKTQRDPRFHLKSRTATDLRDRARNRFPEVIERIKREEEELRRERGTSKPSSETSTDQFHDTANAIPPSFSQDLRHESPEAGELLDPNPSPRSQEVMNGGAPQSSRGGIDIANLLQHQHNS